MPNDDLTKLLSDDLTKLPNDDLTKIDAQIKRRNQNLKAASIRVKIERKGHSLYARATLPPKPDSSRKRPFQQHVPLDVKATPEGLRRAEAEAKKIGAALDLKEFDWADYPLRLGQKTEGQTVADWKSAHEANYFKIHQRTPTRNLSFRSKYHAYLKRLPQEQTLTQAVLERGIEATEPDSYTRSAMCFACKALGLFAGIDVSFITEEMKGAYSSHKPAPRKLPSDEMIVEGFDKIRDPRWQRVYGLMATFGLRPHEVFNCDTQDLEQGGYILRVLKTTKTGEREVRPLHPEWIDQFGLRQPLLPNASGRCNKEFGGSVSSTFRKYGISFPPYHLRHAYAVRCIRFGLHITLAARWMGHSVEVHTTVYQREIEKTFHDEAFERSIQNPQRPQPPTVKRVQQELIGDSVLTA